MSGFDCACDAARGCCSLEVGLDFDGGGHSRRHPAHVDAGRCQHCAHVVPAETWPVLAHITARTMLLHIACAVSEGQAVWAQPAFAEALWQAGPVSCQDRHARAHMSMTVSSERSAYSFRASCSPETFCAKLNQNPQCQQSTLPSRSDAHALRCVPMNRWI